MPTRQATAMLWRTTCWVNSRSRQTARRGSSSGEVYVADVDRNHQRIEVGNAVRTAKIGAPFAGQAYAIGDDIVMNKLGGGKTAGDIDSIVMPAQQQVVTEEKILHPTMGSDRFGEFRPQHAPCLVLFHPRLDLINSDPLAREQERRR